VHITPVTEIFNMQQVRSNRESIHETAARGGSGVGGSSTVGRPEISSLLNDYSHTQRHCM
jgi:hypothetical protein